MPDIAELAWAAGFIDGEGSITLVRDKNRNRLLPRINVYNTNPFPLVKLQQLFGGSVHQVKRDRCYWRWKPSFVWELQNAPACQVAQQLALYLVIKKPHAELLAQYEKTIRRGVGRSRHLEPELVKERESIRQSLMDLSKRKYALDSTGSPTPLKIN